jgi:hypothetical protein
MLLFSRRLKNCLFLFIFYLFYSLPNYGLQGSEFTGEEGPECALKACPTCLKNRAVSTRFLYTLSCRSNFILFVNSVLYWCVTLRYLHRCSSAKTSPGYQELNRKPIQYKSGSNHLATPHSENCGKQRTSLWWLFLWGFQILVIFLPQSIQSAMLSVHTSEFGPPIPKRGQTLWYSMYNIIPLRF